MKASTIWILCDSIFEKPVSVWESEKLLLEEKKKLEKFGENPDNLEWSSSFYGIALKINESYRV